MENTSKHRLKQKDLVMNIFGFFSEEYERSNAGSIWEITLPIEKIINNLKIKCHVSYKSDLWVWTQLKRYEEELGVKIFKKVKTAKNDKQFAISINHPFTNFFQKQHLYVTEKIKVANGVFDKIQEYTRKNNSKEPIKIFLGAGTLCYHLSTIFAERSLQNETKYFVHTNNLGALSQLIAPGINHNNIIVSIPEGKVDPVTYTIVGENNDFCANADFDFIIQGTSCINDGNLFIESHIENKRKKAILRNTRGQKILALTTHEFSTKPLESTQCYGNMKDYDFIIVPKKSIDSSIKKEHEKIFEESKKYLSPVIINWNYEIYRVDI